MAKIPDKIKAWRRKGEKWEQPDASRDWKAQGKTFRASDAVTHNTLSNLPADEGRPRH